MVLEWPRLLEALAGHARSTMGAARCRALELATSLHDSQRRQQETTEMGQLQASGEALPTLAFPDIRDPLARAKKGAALEVRELRIARWCWSCWRRVAVLWGGINTTRPRWHPSRTPAIGRGTATRENSAGCGDPSRRLDQGVGDAGVAALDPSGTGAQTADEASGGSDPALASL